MEIVFPDIARVPSRHVPRRDMNPLVETVRAKMEAGILPVERPAKLWVGNGDGQTCSVCDRAIHNEQTEYEAQYEQRPTMRLHMDCYRVWDTERQRRGDSSAAETP